MNSFPSYIEIAGRRIGSGAPCYVIAEGGVSHFGSMEKARQLIDLAKDGGADVYKTQHFRTDQLVGPSAPDWRERLRSKEMPDDAIVEMQAYCENRELPFLCTPHDESVLEFLDKVVNVPAFKIGSGEVENWPFLANVARRGKPIVISTGMYELSQIRTAIDVLADNGCKELAILHCVTSYPAPPEAINLKVMDQIREFFDGPVGYSDHTVGTAIPLAAVALGANLIEKHITIDRDVPNAQDWKVSCDPGNFRQFVSDIRAIEMAVGGGRKSLSTLELQSIKWARKSLTAKIDMAAGTLLTAEMLVAQRPGVGIPPSKLDSIIGHRLTRAVTAGELIAEEMFT